jgi:hypothetical protein
VHARAQRRTEQQARMVTVRARVQRRGFGPPGDFSSHLMAKALHVCSGQEGGQEMKDARQRMQGKRVA